jgi:hypothetical protein
MKLRILAALTLVVAIGAAHPDLTRPAVKNPAGDDYVAGQLILQLRPTQRGFVNLSVRDEVARFGIDGLDALCERWRVDDITPLLAHPNPSEHDRRFGADLQYVVQFPVDQAYEPVAAAFRARTEVEYVCPNALLKLDEMPNDPYYANQWHLAKLTGPVAWTIAHGSTSVKNLVIDDGVDWDHPDIKANFWINTPEDINGNGQYDTASVGNGGDRDGIDQDGNGYADDVIGWDFITGDYNPMPQAGDDHGTHCWGTVNAVTNNGVGISGPTWNSRSMAARAGYGGSVYLSAAVSAVYYGIAKGAFAFSMSFGGSSTYPPLQNACADAWASGCVLFGSAGNDGQEAMRYPACYAGVENTAASNQGDNRAGFSNYGTWVDISSPGEGIYSTLPRSMGNYGSMDGTSMACPLAAGVACWIKSLMPGLTNQQVIDTLHHYCDSMPDPLYAQGKLGAGRVSLGNVVLKTRYCNLTLTGSRVNSPGGSPDPGETFGLIITLSNDAAWPTATAVSADIACAHPGVNIIKSTATFPNIAPGGSQNCSADSFVIAVSDTTPPQNIRFVLTLNATPTVLNPTASLPLRVGQSRILLVDDDAGADYERWYTAALDTTGALYDRWTVATQGSPASDSLLRYPVVVWFTGNDSSTTLGSVDRDNLAAFLDAGHNLLICGQSIAQDIRDEPFLANYLHSTFVTDSTGRIYVVGTDAEIMAYDTAALGGSGGANNGLRSSDGVTPANGGLGIGVYRDHPDPSVQAIVRYEGTYKTVFFACAFEAIDQSATRYIQKWTLMRNVLSWFGERIPNIDIEEGRPALAALQPQALAISPNPMTRYTQVSFTAPLSGEARLRVWSVTGRLAAEQAMTVSAGENASFRLDASGLANGTYLVQLVTSAGIWAQKTAVLR